MGFYTAIVVLNDALDAIKRNPTEFTENLVKAVQGYTVRSERDIAAGGHINAAQVITQAHSDNYHLIAFGGNTGHDLGHCGSWSSMYPQLKVEALAVMWLRQVANMYGFRLVKKPGHEAAATRAGHGIS